jgi:hypothetical protein
MTSENNVQKPQLSQTGDPALIAAEYKALRDEMLKRVEFRYQLLNLTLISAGTLLAAGVHADVSAAVLLVYPILAAFLAAGWVHNANTIVPLARYIREELEAKHSGLGWENYLKTHADRRFLYEGLGLIYASGIFLSTQLITLVLGILKSTATSTDLVLLAGDLIAILFTVAILLLSRRMYRTAHHQT